MTHPQTYSHVECFQLGYELALRDLQPTLETLIETLADVTDRIEDDTTYYYLKDHVDQAIRDARSAWRTVHTDMGLDQPDKTHT